MYNKDGQVGHYRMRKLNNGLRKNLIIFYLIYILFFIHLININFIFFLNKPCIGIGHEDLMKNQHKFLLKFIKKITKDMYLFFP
jgi:hypothetical protein